MMNYKKIYVGKALVTEHHGHSGVVKLVLGDSPLRWRKNIYERSNHYQRLSHGFINDKKVEGKVLSTDGNFADLFDNMDIGDITTMFIIRADKNGDSIEKMLATSQTGVMNKFIEKEAGEKCVEF